MVLDKEFELSLEGCVLLAISSEDFRFFDESGFDLTDAISAGEGVKGVGKSLDILLREGHSAWSGWWCRNAGRMGLSSGSLF